MSNVQFNRVVVYGVKDFGDHVEQVEDREAEFFSLYGFVPAFNGSEFAVCIGDFGTRDEAELVREMLGY